MNRVRTKHLEVALLDSGPKGAPVALLLHGWPDRVTIPAASEKVALKYSGPFERIVVDGVGHFLPREAPDVVAEHLVRHFGAEGRAPRW
jgi:hypothetical protein